MGQQQQQKHNFQQQVTPNFNQQNNNAIQQEKKLQHTGSIFDLNIKSLDFDQPTQQHQQGVYNQNLNRQLNLHQYQNNSQNNLNRPQGQFPAPAAATSQQQQAAAAAAAQQANVLRQQQNFIHQQQLQQQKQISPQVLAGNISGGPHTVNSKQQSLASSPVNSLSNASVST